MEKTSQYRVNKILVGNVTINSDIKYKEATRKWGRSQERTVPVLDLARDLDRFARNSAREAENKINKLNKWGEKKGETRVTYIALWGMP